jgi:hypothetical protein
VKCSFFARKGVKVRTEQEWRQTHDQHVKALGRPYTTQRQAENPNPAVGWLICPCGARLLGLEYGTRATPPKPE